jgi:hypothetical protein
MSRDDVCGCCWCRDEPDPDINDYGWADDQQIARLTGEPRTP